MAGDEGVLIHKDSIPRIRKSVEFTEQFIPGPVAKSTKRVVEVGKKCRWEFRIILFGYPDSGSISVPMRVKDSGGSYVQSGIVIPFNSSPSALRSVLASHPQVAIDQVEVYSPGGDLPQCEMAFRFLGGIKTKEVQFLNYTNNLSGGWVPHALIRLARG